MSNVSTLLLFLGGALRLGLSISFAQDITRLGGDLTSEIPGHNAIQVFAPNVTDPDRMSTQLAGFSVFHKINLKEDGVGPRYNNSSCGGCHVHNGRGPLRFGRNVIQETTVVVKVSLPGTESDGSPKKVPGIGEQLQDQSVSGKRYFKLKLHWHVVRGQYADGKKYRLRSPRLSFELPEGLGKVLYSLRMSPIIIGPGLLENIPDAEILEQSDPDDFDGDGISGRPNYVGNVQTGTTVIGRFGFKSSQPTVAQQSAAASANDMGITNILFPGSDGSKELPDNDFDQLVLYLTLAGVPIATNQTDPKVIQGKGLFKTLGCDACHRITMHTKESVDPELANQEFHPFTDLLLHDMGAGLSDRRPDHVATGAEWRTTPLWGLGFSSTVSNVRPLFLHDGRARSITEAILWHGGESRFSQRRFVKLSTSDRAALIAFLKSL